MTARALIVLLGTWLLFATWVLPGGAAPPRLTDFWVGLALVAAALLAASRPSFRFLATALGLWLVAAPFVLAPRALATTVNEVSTGALVVLLSLVPEEIEERLERRLGTREPTAP
ncbi:MAG TPA: hypothetical protein VHF22_08065 [Planctomycetota bacterium]|nr:hypothetical protein [Planctomycetota bacterium]